MPTCKNCNQKYEEAQNIATACRFHPGEYHSTSRADTSEEGSWQCCGEYGTVQCRCLFYSIGWWDNHHDPPTGGCKVQAHVPQDAGAEK